MDGVDGCGCCTADADVDAVLGVVQHLQPIDLRAGIERARAVNTRLETGARSRHKAAIARRTCFRPGCIVRVAGAPLPVIARAGSARLRSVIRRVELTRIASDLFSNSALPDGPQPELDWDGN